MIWQENTLNAQEVVDFQRRMGWKPDSPALWEAALAGDRYDVSARKEDGTLIAMGRLLGDGALYWYVNDVFVFTPYQGQGIGRAVVQRLLAYARGHSLPGSEASVCLMAAEGKEGFYEKLGFRARPCPGEGAGMELELTDE